MKSDFELWRRMLIYF